MKATFFNYIWRETDPIFCSQKYLALMGDSYGWIGGFDDTGLRLFIPYVIKKKIFVKYLTFHSSPIITGSELSEEEELCFLDNCISQFKISGIDFCTQPVNHAIFRAYPKRSIYAAFGSYILDLTRSEDELWNGFHHKHRNVILNAKKKGVIIKFNMPDSVNISYEIIRRTMFRSKMDMIPKLKFLKLIESLGANICIAIAFHEGKPMGCAVFPFSLYGAYYLYGGSSDLPVLGSMNLLHWEAIKYFKNLDVKRYDFVGARLKPIPGSKVEGIQRFKERFGPVMYKGYLWKIPITYKYYLFEIVLKIKNGFRGDIIDQELLYRNTKNE